MLSVKDFAYSGHKLCEAIRRYTKHDIKIFTGVDPNPYKFPGDSQIKDRREVQRRINTSDIVHLKGDWAAKDGYLGMKIMHKPVVVTVCGSFFRKKVQGGYERFKPKDFDRAVLRTSFTPDLLYPDFSEIWTPHPIDSVGKPNVFKQSYPPILIHMPTQRTKKDTAFIMDVVRKLKPVNWKMYEKLPFRRAVEVRKEATIFLDQFRVGFYGNSALEAMQFGIPVGCWISPQAKNQAKGKLQGCPVITIGKDVNMWAKLFTNILGSDMKALSEATKWWCDEIHSYQSVAKQWDKIYNTIGSTVCTTTEA